MDKIRPGCYLTYPLEAKRRKHLVFYCDTFNHLIIMKECFSHLNQTSATFPVTALNEPICTFGRLKLKTNLFESTTIRLNRYQSI